MAFGHGQRLYHGRIDSHSAGNCGHCDFTENHQGKKNPLIFKLHNNPETTGTEVVPPVAINKVKP